ncbi:MAG TPA: UDP-N-acetylmuramoyl-L-alanyl-D-glutamate--2,6-diaminopimelate ligase [Gemmatimonadaceae bacterium]|nr:UDP-N-acetylmuramoyl-L-alanyl-D-glutamate--2,6-diaminopimelate ligase [Gemmatimonadaceae bacterium]
MSIATDLLVDALRDAGLLAGTRGHLPAVLAAVTDDSRQVGRGGLFIAVRGSLRDGHDFLDAARQAGAAAAVLEDAARTDLPAIVVREGRRAAAIVAAAAYGWPARRLRLVGVTGTNGKTTTVHMLRHLLDAPGARSASIGTLGVRIGSEGTPLDGGSGLTTPGPVELQRVFRALADVGVRTVSMELSSHALDQHRAEGVSFDAAVFTNLTRDHLDYHHTMQAYFEAKARLADQLAPGGVVVANADDPAWDALRARGRRIRFGVEAADADARADDLQVGPQGSAFTLQLGQERHPALLPLIGDFNIANALGASAAAWALGQTPARIAGLLSSMPQVPGRLERLLDRPLVLRDYCHTPDALTRALDALRPFTAGRLICVFGAGGDRDRGKRPLMGAAAEAGADVVVVTSDNPRTEDPERIIDDVVAGMTRTGYVRMADRRAAIARALDLARPDDVVLLAGKGHETYQVIGTTNVPFDEKMIVRELRGSAA